VEVDAAEIEPEELRRQAYHAAIRLLSRRDHSSAELKKKLSSRQYRGLSFDEAAIDEAIAQLTTEGYLDDRRVAAHMAELRCAAGYGPRAIRAKLMERGFNSGDVGDALALLEGEVGLNWAAHAQNTLCKRFSAADIASREPRMEGRMARFLQSRGFSSSDALRALQAARSHSVS